MMRYDSMNQFSRRTLRLQRTIVLLFVCVLPHPLHSLVVEVELDPVSYQSICRGVWLVVEAGTIVHRKAILQVLEGEILRALGSSLTPRRLSAREATAVPNAPVAAATYTATNVINTKMLHREYCGHRRGGLSRCGSSWDMTSAYSD